MGASKDYFMNLRQQEDNFKNVRTPLPTEVKHEVKKPLKPKKK